MNIQPGYSFDVVLLVPKYSDISSRSTVDISVDLGKGIVLKIPIVSANMKNVTEAKMAKAIAELGGLAILHRFMSYNELIELYDNLTEKTEYRNFIGCSVGVKTADYILVDELVVDHNCKIICIDVAHGDHILCENMVRYISEKYPNVLLIAGNVATHLGAMRLSRAGADVVKCGIGNGSSCLTRIETGNGVPQLTALEDVYHSSFNGTSDRDYKIIADGGIRRAGDIVKALCFSDCVMLGNVLAGTNEAPGKTFTLDGVDYKEYAGSSTFKTSHVEGVSALVPTKGPVSKVVEKLMEGLRSGCSYQGAKNLVELKEDPEFIAVTHAGLIESHPHDVKLKG